MKLRRATIKLFLRWKLDVCALSKSKTKGRGEVVGRERGSVTVTKVISAMCSGVE